MARRLTLRKETLASLSDDQLAGVAGGLPITHNCNSLDFCRVTNVEVLTVAVRACLGTTA